MEKVGNAMLGIGAVGVFALAGCDFGDRTGLMVLAFAIVVGLVVSGLKLKQKGELS